MYIHGSFYNKQDEKVTVEIVTHGDRTTEREIGKEEDGIYFSDDPVEITSQVNDTLDVLLCYQASVRLLCKDHVPDFFCNSCREAVVNIFVDDKCYFAGFIEPQVFSQGYNEELDEVELTCIDCLSALQYSNYRNIGTSGVTYAGVKASAGQRTFYDILKEMLEGVTDGVDLTGKGTLKMYVDSSVVLRKRTMTFWSMRHISISELLFLGDEEDDTWTQEDVMTEILKYLNLHIVQDGTSFYIFNWMNARGKNSTAVAISFRDIITMDTAYKSFSIRKKEIDTSLVADCDTQMSITQTYNQILLTDNVTEVENVIESPLDSDSLQVAGNYQKYMTEYISEGEGQKAYKGMRAMTTGRNDYTYDGASTVDWYAWPKSVRNWKFYGGGDHTADIYSKYPADGTRQQDILNEGMTAGIGACVCAFGKIERKQNLRDNAPITSVSMDDYLVVSLMGDDRDGRQKPTDTDILAACPVAEYTGNTSGGTFSPADADTTNYIVVSGKMALSPIVAETDTYAKMANYDNWNDHTLYGRWWHQTVASRNNTDGRYYTRQYWKADSWRDEVASDGAEADTDRPNAKDCHATFYPYTGTDLQDCEFKYAAVCEGDKTTYKEEDNVSKVGLLACMLVIGDKCVVEKLKGEDLGTGVAGTGNGETDDYVWMTYKERSECKDDAEYYAQSFTIGIDPKIGDKILGSEFDIQKNAPYTKGITAEGTAIPIRMEDRVSGRVQFRILGPVNAVWNQVTRRHHSFWRHTKWSSDDVQLLQKACAIMLKDFKVEVVSDNGRMGAVTDDKDIVYMSDSRDDFINKKDDLEFKITTALTSEECKRMGVNNAVKLSSPYCDLDGGGALLGLYGNTGDGTYKPEAMYVDTCYEEWHVPRIVIEQGILHGSDVGLFGKFTYPTLGKDFFIQGVDRNLGEGTAKVTLKEFF